MKNYPTAWQRRILWTVFTYLSIVVGGAVALGLIGLFGRTVAFFQPVLLPFALAAVLAYLLEPVVRTFTARTRLSRTWAVLVTFLLILLALGLLGVAIVPRIYDSSSQMVQGAPEYARKAQERLLSLLDASEQRLAKLNALLPGSKPAPSATPAPSPTPEPSASPQGAPAASPDSNKGDAQSKEGDKGENKAADKGEDKDKGKSSASDVFQPNGIRNYIQKQLPALESRVPAVLDSVWHLLINSLGGVLGAAGALLDAVIIPVYLYFLLVESRNIARHWNEYLPLRDSPFKKEVVSVLLEINGYIVAFFRGQLVVSTIDAILIGGALAIMGLDFAFFVGLLVVVLTFIPYLGIILCYIPAILIAIIQYGDFWHPLYVVAIMFGVQTLESTIISPKIVGDSVGLHPVTVILSVFGWGLLLGGPIGAVLAVPLSATVKVLLRRYVWEMSGRGRHFVPLGGAAAAGLQAVNEQTEEAVHGKQDADGPRRAAPPLEDNLPPAPAMSESPHPPRPTAQK